jgi:hypothetical protein
VIGIVTDLAAGNIRHLLVEQFGQPAQDAALGLAAQAEQNEILLGQHRVHNLRNNRIFIAHNAREDWLLGLQPGNQVLAQLVFDAALLQARFVELFAALQLTQGLGKTGGHKCCSLERISGADERLPLLITLHHQAFPAAT